MQGRTIARPALIETSELGSAMEPAGLVSIAQAIATLTTSRKLSLWLHEMSHALVALSLGHRELSVEMKSSTPSVTVEGPISRKHSVIIRHAGWISSLLLACAWTLGVLLPTVAVDEVEVSSSQGSSLGGGGSSGSEGDGAAGGRSGVYALAAITAAVFTYTACEAMLSDLFSSSSQSLSRFFCGNFGLLLLDQASAGKVDYYLRRMLRVTMMRGAQSAGLVTYQKNRRPGRIDTRGVRHRVVNGKRTDLSEKLLDKARSITRPKAINAPQIFQGHTRFATSSIANLSGTHPHQWSER